MNQNFTPENNSKKVSMEKTLKSLRDFATKLPMPTKQSCLWAFVFLGLFTFTAFSAQDYTNQNGNFFQRMLNVMKAEVAEVMVEADAISEQQAQRLFAGAFSCDAGFYQVLGTELKILNIDNGNYDDLSGSASNALNAVGYNVNDDYMYGLVVTSTGPLTGTGELVRMDNDGNSTVVSNVGETSIAGDMDDNDQLWIRGGGGNGRNLKTISVNSPYTVTRIVFGPSSLDLNGITMADIVIIGDFIYAMGSDHMLTIWDINNQTISRKNITGWAYGTGSTGTGVLAPGETFGAGWTDASGNLYFANNGDVGVQAVVWEIANFSGAGDATATWITDSENTALNDGVSCPQAISPFAARAASGNCTNPELVTNGGLETVTNWSPPDVNGANTWPERDFGTAINLFANNVAGWDVTTSSSTPELRGGASSTYYNPHEGDYFAAVLYTEIVGTEVTTEVGKEYEINFSYANCAVYRENGGSGNFELLGVDGVRIIIDGVEVDTLAANNTVVAGGKTPGDWLQGTYTFTAANATTSIAFSSASSVSPNIGYACIDNLSVKEACATTPSTDCDNTTNIIGNESFETVTNWSPPDVNGANTWPERDFGTATNLFANNVSGWDVTTSSSTPELRGGAGSTYYNPYEGDYFAAVLYTEIVGTDVTTEVGKEYQLNFSYANCAVYRENGGSGNFELQGVDGVRIIIDGVEVDTLAANNTVVSGGKTPGDWLQGTYTFTAANTTTSIAFSSASSVSPNIGYACVDNIKLVESCGVVDSDMDGVPDSEEMNDGMNPNSFTDYKDSDGGGVPDWIETTGLPNAGLPATNPNDPTDDVTQDTDNDDFMDWFEILAGSDPNDGSTMPADADGDHIPDAVEQQGPNNGDGNGDGTPDFQQDNVTATINPNTHEFVIIEADGGCGTVNVLTMLRNDQLAVPDPEVTYEIGLHDFELTCGAPGQTATIKVYWDSLYDTSSWAYRKVNSTTGQGIDITSAVSYSTATIGSKTVTVSTYTVTDGGPFDEDGAVNGVIIDPAGPASGSSCTDTNKYAANCDFDGDTINNEDDLDDDNDGILDTDEYAICNSPILLDGDLSSLTNWTATEIATHNGAVIASEDCQFADAGEFLLAQNASVLSTTFEFNKIRANLAWNNGTGSGPACSGSDDMVLLMSVNGTNYLKMTTHEGGTINQQIGVATVEGLNGATVDVSSINHGTYQNWTFTPVTITLPSPTIFEEVAFTLEDEDGNDDIAIDHVAIVTPAVGGSGTVLNCFQDTDNDNVYNHFDLDSDGDGCYDSYEAGVTGVTADGSASDSLAIVTTDTTGVGANGFANTLESDDTNAAAANYTTTYPDATDANVNNCPQPCTDLTLMAGNCDFDNDGVANSEDLDDDNDGILDTEENIYGLQNGGSPTSNIEGNNTTEFPNWTTTGATSNATVNGVAGMNVLQDDGVVSFTQTIAGSGCLSNNPVIYTQTLFNDGPSGDSEVTTLKYYVGNVLYATLSSSDGIGGSGTITYQNGATGNTTTWNTLPNVTNLYITLPANINLPAEVKMEITPTGNGNASDDLSIYRINLSGIDTDCDDIPDYLDLDSDGDGCYDSYEAGVTGATADGSASDSLAIVTTDTTGVGANGFANSLETSGNGVYTGTYTYAQATDMVSACPVDCATANNMADNCDFDGDNIPNIDDIDDDNDGILDVDESGVKYLTCTTPPANPNGGEVRQQYWAANAGPTTLTATTWGNAITAGPDPMDPSNGPFWGATDAEYSALHTYNGTSTTDATIAVSASVVIGGSSAAGEGFVIDAFVSLPSRACISNIAGSVVDEIMVRAAGRSGNSAHSHWYTPSANPNAAQEFTRMTKPHNTGTLDFSVTDIVDGSGVFNNGQYYTGPTPNPAEQNGNLIISLEDVATPHFFRGYVIDPAANGSLTYEYSTDGGTTWSVFPNTWFSANATDQATAIAAESIETWTCDNGNCTSNLGNTETESNLIANGAVTCPLDIDTDMDNIPNRFDLDSDGDGCYDLAESGAGAVGDSLVYQNSASPTVGNNGFADNLETSVDSDTISYTLQPYHIDSTQNACADFDNDGVGDLIDIDDDNDGILDTVEDAECATNAGSLDLSLQFSNLAANSQTTQALRAAAWQADITDAGTQVGRLYFTALNNGAANTFSNNYTAAGWPAPAVMLENSSDSETIAADFGAGTNNIVVGGVNVGSVSFAQYTATLENTTAQSQEYTLSYVSNASEVPGVNLGINHNSAPSTVEAIFDDSKVTATVTDYNTPNLFDPITSLHTAGFTGGAQTVSVMSETPFNITDSSGGIIGTGGNTANSIGYSINYTVTLAPGESTDIIAIDRGAINVDNYGFLVSKFVPCLADTDGDGIKNSLDLDSDGDGCYDSYEASVTGSTNNGSVTDSLAATTNAQVGNNGFANDLEDNDTENAAINYNSTYSLYSLSDNLNVCADTDNDGIGDLVDIDDDNDGILDADESPDCFYNQVELGLLNTDDRTAAIIIASDLTVTNLTNALDASATTYPTFTNAQSVVGVNILSLEFISALELSNITLKYTTTNSIFNSTNNATNLTTVVVQGSNSGNSWTTLSTPKVVGRAAETGNINSFPITLNTGNYKYYRLTGVGPTGNTYSAGRIGNIEVTTNGFTQSDHTKPACAADIDNDGNYNHVDLDADGDGCFDAYEAGAVASSADSVVATTMLEVGANGLANAKESGIESDSLNYTPNINYAQSDFLNVCADTDDDGILDLVDIDDDNDGIRDSEESPSCYYTEDEIELVSNITTELTIYNGNTIDRSFDKNAATFSAFNLNQAIAGKELFNISMTNPAAIASVDYIPRSWALSQTTSTNKFKLQGYDGSSWVDLSGDTSIAVTSGMASILNTLAPNLEVTAVRIIGVSGNSYYSGVTEMSLTVNNFKAELFPRLTCQVDTDTNGVYNHLDLDSDGDGCSDAKESGATTDDTAGFSFQADTTAGDVNRNGLADVVEIGTTGATNYKSYYRYAISALDDGCLDTDDDGIADLLDLDDDNDGISDVKECFNLSLNMTPNDYAYDLLQATFHGLVARTEDGYTANGQTYGPTGGTVLIPTPITRENGYEYSGDLLLATVGGTGGQTVLLTTTGFFAFGGQGQVVSTAFTSSTAVDSLEISMPDGVEPEDIGMMVGTVQSLALLTRSGDVYTLSQVAGVYGDGTTTVNNEWHKAQTPTPISVIRMVPGNVFAMDFFGDFYTWGTNSYLGDGNAKANLTTPTKMTSPILSSDYTVQVALGGNGVSPSYYILSSNGRIYSMGGNLGGVLGIGSTAQQTNWVTVRNPSNTGDLTDVVFISATDHDVIYPTASAIQADGSLLNWGNNNTGMLGTGNSPTLPKVPTGTESLNHVYVENGGHITPTAANGLYCNTGHNSGGGYGDGTTTSITAYQCNALVVPLTALRKLSNCDDDNDGLPNHLDPDSDNDGCPDAIEAGHGVTVFTPASVGTNGLADSVETMAESGKLNFDVPEFITLDSLVNLCDDYDNDGIGDFLDIDDDNDGIPDTEEHDCAIAVVGTDNISTGAKLATGTMIAGAKTVGYTINWTNLNGAFALETTDKGLHYVVQDATSNGDYTSHIRILGNEAGVNIGSVEWGPNLTESTNAGNQNAAQTIELNWKPSIIKATVIDPDNQLDIANGTLISAGQTIVQAADYVAANPPTWKIIFNTNLAKVDLEFRPKHTSTTGNLANEGYSVVTNICSPLDSDMDGQPNHLDIDSDNDGCFDLVESGAGMIGDSLQTGPFGANGLADTVEVMVDGGITNYESFYVTNALDSMTADCEDFDMDGVVDAVDIDDDNDGVLDVDEVICGDLGAGINETKTNNGGGSGMHIASASYLLGSDTMHFDFLLESHASYFYHNVAFNSPGTFDWTSYHNTVPPTETYDFDMPANNKVNGSIKWGPNVTTNLNTQYNQNSAGGTIVLNFTSGLTGIMHDPSGQTDIADGTVMMPGDTLQRLSGTTQTRTWYVEFKLTDYTEDFQLVADYVTAPSWFSGAIDYANLTACEELDTDMDGIPNQFDRDSDGDGCPDAVEAGAITSTSTSDSLVATTFAEVGLNGLANNLETSLDNDTINYNSTYKTAGISDFLNACADTDQDGVPDLVDIDDDNDGIIDSDESPNCYYTASDVAIIDVTTTLTNYNTNAAYLFSEAYDGVLNNHGPYGVLNTPITGETVYEVELNLAAPLSSMDIVYNYSVFNANSEFQWQGYDGTDWVALTDTLTETTNTNTTRNYVFDQNTGDYKKYRLQGISGTTYYNRIYEIVPHVGNFVGAKYPRVFCSADTDGDGIYNHLDLDSDGDGCYDMVEAGAGPIGDSLVIPFAQTTGVGDNGLADIVETSPESDSIAYVLQPYYQDSTQNACSDYDMDGVGDVIDIDDDNDGVLDVDEVSCMTIGAGINESAPINGGGTGIHTANASYLLGTDSLHFDVEVLGHQSYWRVNDGFDGNTFDFVSYSTTLPTTETYNFDFPANNKVNGSIKWGPDQGNNNTNSNATTNNTATTIGITFPAGVNAVFYDPDNQTDVANATPINSGFTFSRLAGTPTTRTWYVAFTFSNFTNDFQLVVDYPAAPAWFGGGIDFSNLTACEELDTDMDGILNQFDRDSDGDGCPDAIEAGARTGSGLADSLIAQSFADVGFNGLADSIETSTESGVVTYTSNYSTAALSDFINGCADTDMDGIPDMVDIDDDNDGVRDSEESPSCYLAQSDLGIESGDRTAIISASSEATFFNTTYVPNNGFDGAANTYLRYLNNTSVANKAVIQFELPVPVELSEVNLKHLNTNSIFNAANNTTTLPTAVKLQALSAGSWVDLTPLDTVDRISTGNQELFTVTQNQGKYSTYRIFATEGTTYSNGYVTEIELTIGNFRPEDYPKLTCGEDTDNDGVYNHLDLDSDNDGCYDLTESGAGAIGDSLTIPAGTTTGVGANGLADALESSPESDSVIYVSTYAALALDSLNTDACKDNDMDGISDLIDIDDDNDGILDIDECGTVPSVEQDYYQWSKTGGWTINSASQAAIYTDNATDHRLFTTADLSNLPDTLVMNLKMRANGFNNVITSAQMATLSFQISGTPYIVMTNPSGGNMVNVTTQNGANSSLANFPITTTSGPFTDLVAKIPNPKLTNADLEWSFTSTNDDWSVSLVSFAPETTANFCADADEDGIPNSFDLDSDGDGCPDAAEAGHGQMILADSTIVSGMTGVGANGLLDAVETSADSDTIDYTIDSTGTNANFLDSLIRTACPTAEIIAENDRDTTTQGVTVAIDILSNDSIALTVIDTAGIQLTTTSNGSATVNSDGTIDYTPVATFFGTDTIEYIVCDTFTAPNTTCDTAMVFVEVLLDTDGDGVANVVDIDDDNDGILDTEECSISAFNTNSTDVNLAQLLGGDTIMIGSTNVSVTTTGTVNAFTTDGNLVSGAHINPGNGVSTSSMTIHFSEPVSYFETTFEAQQDEEEITFSHPATTVTNRLNSTYGVATAIMSQAILENSGLTLRSNLTDAMGSNTSSSFGSNSTVVWNFASPVTNLTISHTGADRGNADGATNYNGAIIGGAFKFADKPFCDPDGDGISNELDLDSDNDGIPDNVEGQTTAGYIAPTGTDTDMDGLDDAYDTDCIGVGNPAGCAAAGMAITPVDTDTNSIENLPDYLDLDSDDDGLFDIAESTWSALDTDMDGRTNGNVGTNGLDDTQESTDSWTDVNGNINTPSTQQNQQSPATTEVDYRDNNTPPTITYAIDTTYVEGDTAIVMDVMSIDSTESEVDSTLAYSLTGVDVALLEIDSLTGELTFVNSPSYGNPMDNGTNNTYEVGVIVCDIHNECDTQDITIYILPDADLDGTPDALDIDDDNDGIPDLVESPIDPNTDADNDGIPAYLDDNDTNSSIGNDDNAVQSAFDADGDGLPNHIDLDADNDGLADNIEGQTTAGYIAPVGSDADQDGLDDAYDTDCIAVGSPAGCAAAGMPITNPVDTDNDTTENLPDYLDLDSDNDGTFDIVEIGQGALDTDNDGRTNGTVGINGLDNTLEAVDIFADINGNILTTDTPADDLQNTANPNSAEVDYREINAAPMAVDDAHATNEDTPTIIDVQNNDSDPNSDMPLVTTIIGNPTNGSVNVISGDSIGYNPSPNFTGLDTITYQICDTLTPALCDTAIVVITVLPVNDAPVALNDSTTTDEDTPVIVDVQINDSDIEDSTLVTTIITQPTDGIVTILGTDSINYVPNANFNGLDTLTYSICDNESPALCDTAMVVITVDAVNDKPVAIDDTETTDEDTPVVVDVQANDNDVEDSTLVTTILDDVNFGTTTILGADSIQYTPNANYFGMDTLRYQICDNESPVLCDTAEVIITINSVNDAPMADMDSLTFNEDEMVNIMVQTNDTDIDMDNITTTILDAPTNGIATVVTMDSIDYTPNANYNGQDTLTYQICDDGTPSLCDTTTVVLTIVPVNDKPVATNDPVIIDEDESVVVDVQLNDVDTEDSTLVTTIITSPVNGSANVIATDSIGYNPDPNFSGVDTIVYKICDNESPALCDTAMVILTINPVNDAPVALNDSTTTNEDTPVIVDVQVNDSDTEDSTLVTTIITQPTDGTVTILGTDSIQYAPNGNFNGLDTLTYSICDNESPALCDTAMVVITVDSVNDKPVAVDDTETTDEDTSVIVDVQTNDSDVEDSTLVTTILDDVNFGTTTILGADSIQYTPNANYFGMDTLRYQICDNESPALCDTAEVIITINSVNDAPMADMDSLTFNEDEMVNIMVQTNDTDIDMDNITTTILDAPNNGTATVVTMDSIDYTPNANYNGQDTLTYQICDDGTPSLCDTTTVVLTIVPVNDKPVATDDTDSVNEDEIVVIDVQMNDIDTEDSTLVTTIITQPTDGTVTILGTDSIQYAPDANFTGMDTLIYQICDNESPALCDTAEVIITVIPVNDTPVAILDRDTTDEDMAVVIDVQINDSDIEDSTLVTTIITQTTDGTATILGLDSISYVPNTNFNGMDTLTYSVCDNESPALCDTAMVVIVIAPVNDAPVAINDTITITEDTMNVVVDIQINDSDLDGDPIITAIIGTSTQGVTPTILSFDSIRYTPPANFTGVDTITYELCDNSFPPLCDTAMVFVNVSPINDKPVANDDTANTDEDTDVVIDVQMNDTDIEDSTLVTTIITQPTNGTVTVLGTDSINYSPALNFFGMDTLTYSICDNDNPVLCDTAQVIITVGPINDMPMANMDADTLDEDTNIVIMVQSDDTDIDMDNLTTVILDSTQNGILSLLNMDSILYTPNPDFYGNDTMMYQICDDGTPSLCDTTSVVFTVMPINDAPIAVLDRDTTDEDEAVTITVQDNDSDVDLDVLTTIIVDTSAKSGMVTVLNGDSISYTPPAGYHGADTIVYQICDTPIAGSGTSLCDTAEVIVFVNNTLLEPVIVPNPLTIEEDSTGMICVPVTDPNAGDTFTTTSCGANNGSPAVVMNGANICLTYVPNPGFAGTDEVCVITCDQTGRCDTSYIPVTVVAPLPPAPDSIAPTVIITPISVPQDSTTDVCSPILDGNPGDTFTATLCGVNHGIATPTVNNDNLCINYAPNAGYTGNDTICVVVCDQTGLCDTAMIPVIVFPPFVTSTTPQPPVVIMPPLVSPEDSMITNCGTIVDPNFGDVHNATVCEQPSNGTIAVSVNNSTHQLCVEITPDPDFVGLDTACVVLCDQTGLCDTVFVPIHIVPSTVNLKVKVMLQGAMLGASDSLMRADLNTAGFLPLVQPYHDSISTRFTHVLGGNEVTTAAVLSANAGTPDEIVDWVFLEIRDGTDATQVVRTVSALVQRDGDVVAAQTGGDLILGHLPGEFFVSVKHRNHLGAMTAEPVLVVSEEVTVDFINSMVDDLFTKVGYDSLAMTTVLGKNALWAGNANTDVKTKYDGTNPDRMIIANNILLDNNNQLDALNYKAKDYYMGDVNMDGVTKYDGANNDRLLIQYLILTYPLNTSNLRNYNDMIEQLPE